MKIININKRKIEVWLVKVSDDKTKDCLKFVEGAYAYTVLLSDYLETLVKDYQDKLKWYYILGLTNVSKPKKPDVTKLPISDEDIGFYKGLFESIENGYSYRNII